MVYKKGFTSIMLIFFVFFAFFVVVFAGVTFYGMETFRDASNITDFQVGNVSFSETYENTLGQGLETVISTLSTVSFALLLGMIIVMLIIGFKTRDKNRLWVILDIFIIIVAFVTAVYISITFNSFINSNEIFLDIYSIDIQKSSAFLLNLPLVIAVVGGLIILATYIPFKRKEPNVLEFN